MKKPQLNPPLQFVVHAIIQHHNERINSAWKAVAPGNDIKDVQNSFPEKLKPYFDDHINRCEKFEKIIQAMTDQHVPYFIGSLFDTGGDIMKISSIRHDLFEHHGCVMIRVFLVPEL